MLLYKVIVFQSFQNPTALNKKMEVWVLDKNTGSFWDLIPTHEHI